MKIEILSGVLILILLVAGPFTGCGRGVQITNMSAKTPQYDVDAFAENYAKAWSSGDAEAVAEFFAEDGSLKVNDDKPAVGRPEISGVARGFMSALPDAVVTKDRL